MMKRIQSVKVIKFPAQNSTTIWWSNIVQLVVLCEMLWPINIVPMGELKGIKWHFVQKCHNGQDNQLPSWGNDQTLPL